MEGKRKTDLNTGTIPIIRRKSGERGDEKEEDKESRTRKRSGDIPLYPTIEKEALLPTAEITGKRQNVESN